jgi:hypothetical protein
MILSHIKRRIPLNHFVVHLPNPLILKIIETAMVLQVFSLYFITIALFSGI